MAANCLRVVASLGLIALLASQPAGADAALTNLSLKGGVCFDTGYKPKPLKDTDSQRGAGDGLNYASTVLGDTLETLFNVFFNAAFGEVKGPDDQGSPDQSGSDSFDPVSGKRSGEREGNGPDGFLAASGPGTFLFSLSHGISGEAGSQFFDPNQQHKSWMVREGGVDSSHVSPASFDTLLYADAAENMTNQPAPVPEPETWVLLLAGLGLVGLAQRRRRGLLARGG